MEHDEDLEETLLKVRRLIEATVSKHRDQSSERNLVAEVKVDDTAIAKTAAEMVRHAAGSLDVVLAAPGEPARAVQRAMPHLAAGGAAGPRIRVLSTQAFLDTGVFDAMLCPADDRCQVRVGRVPALSLIISDGETALTCAESVQGRRASVIRASSVIGTLMTLFDGVWRNAAVASERADFVGRARSDLTQQILAKLQAGVTDEAASRDLRVSVRTYRRYVAEIMTLLGASSRFQAGVRAAELGLLSACSAGVRGNGGARNRASTEVIPRQRR
ncbi:LuxR family transcriptional regulator [Streptomyces sp. TR06-5]|uniref:LuxR family transcriptional regulator n=1 Tax=unclassified Streptomyces TaxID=2593676 RepID=UPI00399F8ABC